MKGVVYRDYHIIGIARLNETTGYWVPTVRVRWREAGKEESFVLDGPQCRFTTRDDAEDYAISMGKDWVDKNNPVP